MPLTGDHFRVLDILPYGPEGSPSDPVRCEYHTAALHDLPEYETLSYRWGAPEPKVTIDVGGGHHIGVTRNLHDALLRLRRRDRRRTIWIDQLCINQDNGVEKAAQVRLMRQIYSKCCCCNIWLDEIPPGVSLRGAQAVLDFMRCQLTDHDTVPEYLREESEGSDEVVKELCEAFKVISPKRHAWWSRIWTVQEAKLPPRKNVLWGPLEFSWETDLTKFMYYYGQSECIGSEAAVRLYQRVIPVIVEDLNLLLPVIVWLNCAIGDMPPLITVFAWREREATNPRDKVFAMQGLMGPGDIDLVHTHQCNYNTPVPQVYSAFTVDMILGLDSLQVLTLELQGDPAMPIADLPRWAIDLQSQTPYYGAEPWYRDPTWQEFNACAGRPLDKSALLGAAAVPEWNLRVIGVTGVFVDTVELIGARMLWANTSNDAGPPDEVVVETLSTWMINARNYYLREQIDLNETQFNENFCRLLLGGLVRGWSWEVVGEPSDEDLRKVAEYLHTGCRDTDWWMNEDLYDQVCNQTFFVTKHGLMGIGHLDTQHGDELWVFDGGNYPFTVRSTKNGGGEEHFDFVACAYVQGIMHGEVYEDETADDLQRTIYLH